MSPGPAASASYCDTQGATPPSMSAAGRIFARQRVVLRLSSRHLVYPSIGAAARSTTALKGERQVTAEPASTNSRLSVSRGVRVARPVAELQDAIDNLAVVGSTTFLIGSAGGSPSGSPPLGQKTTTNRSRPFPPSGVHGTGVLPYSNRRSHRPATQYVGLPGELQSACAPTRRTLEHEHTHRGSRDDGLACGLHPPGRDVGLLCGAAAIGGFSPGRTNPAALGLIPPRRTDAAPVAHADIGMFSTIR
jgi:hypothetical protein